jgi:hypothetical protein
MAYHVLVFQDFAGQPITGLTPTFALFKAVNTNAELEGPEIEELGNGFYRFAYEPYQPYCFVIDAGAAVTDDRLRYIRDVLVPDQSSVAQVLDEVLHHLRGDLHFEVDGNDTYMVLYRDGNVYRKWQITDHRGRPVSWPDTSRLPVNRDRVV